MIDGALFYVLTEPNKITQQEKRISKTSEEKKCIGREVSRTKFINFHFIQNLPISPNFYELYEPTRPFCTRLSCSRLSLNSQRRMISKQTIYTKGFAVGECLVCTKHKRRIRIYISLCIKHKLPKESSFCAVFLSIIKGKEEGKRKRKIV